MQAAFHRHFCCLSVYRRSPVPSRHRGLPALIVVATSLIGRDQRRQPLNSTVFIFGCVALCAAVVFSNICAYKLGKYRGWREVLRKVTPHEKASMALQDGDTLIGVMEMKK